MRNRYASTMIAAAAMAGAAAVAGNPSPAAGIESSGYGGERERIPSRGRDKARRHGAKLKPNRRIISRRVKRRHRRARKAA